MPPKVDAQSCNPLLTLRQCTALLKPLLKMDSAVAFLEPVDPVALNLPDYLTIITQPMDLGTIQNKLNTSQYAPPLQCTHGTSAARPPRLPRLLADCVGARPLVPATDPTRHRLCCTSPATGI